MLERIKRAVVDSYVGAIALGYLLAQVILNFVNVFDRPAAAWLSQKEYANLSQHAAPTGFQYEEALPAAISFVLSLVLWYLLFYWLYLKPARSKTTEPAPDSK